MKVYIYCRNSSEEQKEKGTIEGQLEFAKKFLDLHGPEIGITEFEFYVDEGVSGTIAVKDRPEGARMLKDAARDKQGIILVYRLDRLARSVKHVLDAYEFLEANHVGLRSMTEAFDTTTPTGKFFMTLLASIAALERDTIAERMQLGKDRKITSGKWINGHVPFGYVKNNEGRLEINEQEAKIIQMIFGLYLDGMNMLDIAKYLNANNVPVCGKTKRAVNAVWHKARVHAMLSCEFYTGVYTNYRTSKEGRQEICVSIPVIIEPEIYKSAQQKKLENSTTARGGKGRLYILRGLMECGNCGRTLTGCKSGDNSKSVRHYYRCSGGDDQGSGKKCNTRRIRAEIIEDQIWRFVAETITNPTEYLKILEERLGQSNQETTQVNSESTSIDNAIIERQEARSKVISLLTKGIINETEAETELINLAQEINSLTARREFLFSRKEAALTIEQEILNIQIGLVRWEKVVNQSASPEDRAKIIQRFIDKIEVSMVNGEVEVRPLFRGLELLNSTDERLQTPSIYDFQTLYCFESPSKLTEVQKTAF